MTWADGPENRVSVQIDGRKMKGHIMTTMEILAQVAAGKLKPDEAAKLMPSNGGNKATTATVKEFKGTQVLEFAGNFRPFSMGRSKCKAMIEMIDQVKAFAQS